MSLIQGEVCRVLSFGIFLDEIGVVIGYIIYIILIKLIYCFIYDDVDEMLQLKIKLELEIYVFNDWVK